MQKTILIIEDSVDLAESLEDMLRLKDYQTLKAVDGKTGLELALTTHPDLILLDLRLPDIDGLKILEEIRKDSWGKAVKILILTASDFTEKTAPELNITAKDIIYKSHWGIEELANRVASEVSPRVS